MSWALFGVAAFAASAFGGNAGAQDGQSAQNAQNAQAAALAEAEKFLPYIDNWATCDGLRPKIFKKNADKLLEKIKVWLVSDKTYTVRFGLEMLMCHYLDANFKTEYLDLVTSVKSDEYYINMMIAWYFATALAKQYDAVVPYIEDRKLSPWVHNKTIQKAVESYRITDEQKEYLRSLRIKKG